MDCFKTEILRAVAEIATGLQFSTTIISRNAAQRQIAAFCAAFLLNRAGCPRSIYSYNQAPQRTSHTHRPTRRACLPLRRLPSGTWRRRFPRRRREAPPRLSESPMP